MLFLRSLLFVLSFSFIAAAVGLVVWDVFLAFDLNRVLRRGERPKDSAAAEQPGETSVPAPAPSGEAPAAKAAASPAQLYLSRLTSPGSRPAIRWAAAGKFVFAAALSALLGSSILVVPDGEAAVRISQISGVRPGTLYAGTHFILPLIDRAQLYDVRDKVFSTSAADGTHEKLEVLNVETREGLEVGLAVMVRYRMDPRRLDYVQANLPQPIDQEIVEPVVTSVFRQVAPNYAVRDVFALKREEFRQHAAQIITDRLASDAIVVKEVLLRKVQLPEEYAQGLQGLLLKEQEDDRVSVDQSIEKKKVNIADSQAEAQKVRQIKHAEADAQTRVLMAKAESDSMQYTLPLKQKMIEQSRLEAEARKQTTIQDAEAAAQAKVIDSKAELERRNLMADAEANNIRVTAQAEAEQLQLQAAALKTNPLLVQYTVAQRLSDRVQIMMVPSDGKFFFTNDVLKSAAALDPPVKGK